MMPRKLVIGLAWLPMLSLLAVVGLWTYAILDDVPKSESKYHGEGTMILIFFSVIGAAFMNMILAVLFSILAIASPRLSVVAKVGWTVAFLFLPFLALPAYAHLTPRRLTPAD